MDKKLTYLIALMIAALGTMTLSGCSSSEVSEGSDITADDLPVVDANTDQLPNELDQPMEDAVSGDSLAASADGLAPEASVDVPTSTEAPTSFADTAPPTDSLANSPSYDAPPSMNETASAAPVATADNFSSSGSGGETYEVQAGDTLMKIAFKVYGDVYQWRKVLDQNSDRISDPARLAKGTQLKVDHPASESYYDGHERYLIKSGDTLGLISDDVYGTKQKWKDLWKMNDGLVKDPNRIYAGFFLRYTMTENERQDAERLKSTNSAPLAGSTEEPVRNPSSFQEAKVPGTPTIQQ